MGHWWPGGKHLKHALDIKMGNKSGMSAIDATESNRIYGVGCNIYATGSNNVLAQAVILLTLTFLVSLEGKLTLFSSSAYSCSTLHFITGTVLK